MAVDAQGDVWVADAYNSRLQKLDQNGKYLGALDPVGSPEGRFGGPNAVAVDAKGHVWVADTDKSRVEEFNQYGVEVRHFGSYGTGLGQFEYPMGVAVDGKGNVWVVDPSGNRVQEFNENGEDPRGIALSRVRQRPVRLAGGHCRRPRRECVDHGLLDVKGRGVQ